MLIIRPSDDTNYIKKLSQSCLVKKLKNLHKQVTELCSSYEVVAVC